MNIPYNMYIPARNIDSPIDLEQLRRKIHHSGLSDITAAVSHSISLAEAKIRVDNIVLETVKS